MVIRQDLIFPLPHFRQAYAERMAEGALRLAKSRLAIVGLARNCGPALAANLERLKSLTALAAGWQLHIEANDCTDDTVAVLERFAAANQEASFAYRDLARPQYGAEFAGPRTVAMAEYRTACQEWVQQHAAESDYVVAIDWDQHGGWSHEGLLNGLGWLVEMQGAYGMASVSLFQHKFADGVHWAHYDLWALRGVGQSDCYWDTYTNGYGGFGYSWTPAIGSPPVLVSSAFGGLAIYRTAAYLAGTYDGVDCEHVAFHRSIAEATGQHLYLNPSQRCLMHWIPDEGQHGSH